MKKKDILAIMTIAMMAVGCNSSDEVQQKSPVPIRLTASVVTEAVTRGADDKVIETDASTRGIQENALAGNQKIYVWANETGSSSWDFLKAWTLTADGTTGLTGNAKYYPLDGSTITMNAVHGNFSETLEEDVTTAASLTHSVKANQSDDYEVSDLLFGSATGSDASSSENIALTHKLSKIEVNLSPGYGYVASDLDAAEVHLNNVKPTITIDPTNGTLGTTATGTAITIIPRKDATTGTYEAVIPPQTFTNPDALIAVTTTKNGVTTTSTVPNDVTTYAENTRYVYNVNVINDTGIPLSRVTNDHLGMVVAQNGRVYSSLDEANTFSNAVAMVAYVGTGLGNHGLAYALEYASGSSTHTHSQQWSVVSSWAATKPVENTIEWRSPTLEDYKYMFEAFGGSAHSSSISAGGSYYVGTFRVRLNELGADMQSVYHLINRSYFSSGGSYYSWTLTRNSNINYITWVHLGYDWEKGRARAVLVW